MVAERAWNMQCDYYKNCNVFEECHLLACDAKWYFFHLSSIILLRNNQIHICFVMVHNILVITIHIYSYMEEHIYNKVEGLWKFCVMGW
jgi:hypothetical protein